MVKKIISERFTVTLKNRKKLERELSVDISNRGKEIYINSVKDSAEDEYLAEKVIEAINFGFAVEDALLAKKEDFIFEILNIKDYAKSKNLERVRGRLIGKQGKAKNTISNLSNCVIEIKDNAVGIIGPAEQVQNAQEAIILVIKGSKHSNVYSHLEKNQPKPILDLGLKEDEE
ncbi:hypothetical protein K9L16_02245 [Candidatus Pacearchaeota archaeon]|nr:hypothetical protein [Candidatus Pacearchaeota archaeon]